MAGVEAAGTYAIRRSNYHLFCLTTIRRRTLSFCAWCGIRNRRLLLSFPQVSELSFEPPICDSHVRDLAITADPMPAVGVNVDELIR